MGEITDRVGRIYPPERLKPDHGVPQFSCGESSLDHWLRHRALHNEKSGASRTCVVCSSGRVVGYYALAAGAVDHLEATSRVKRNMPDPVPVMLIGRLAIDSRFQGLGIGADLLRDAVLRTLQVAEIAGIRAILVSAISATAESFYKKFGFIPSPSLPRILMITLAEAVKILGRPG